MFPRPDRYELKYIVDERRAQAIRVYVESYLPADQYMASPRGYHVRSLYLDSPDLQLYRQTLAGHRDRFKLRIRFYNENLDRAKLEIKRRSKDTIRKEVARVNAEAVSRVIASKWPDESQLGWQDRDDESPCAKDNYSMQQFCELRDGLTASSQVLVDYWREAYEAAHRDSPRITFDRDLRAAHCRTEDDLAEPRVDFQPEVGGVILEIKFTPPRPVWLHDLIQQFNLQRRSVPKYVLCADVLKHGAATTVSDPWSVDKDRFKRSTSRE